MCANPAALVTQVDGLLEITLNRPEVLNVVNAALSHVVGTALERAQDDPAVRAIVITGTGRVFCAGMDLLAFVAGAAVDAPGHPEWGFAGLTSHFVDKPLIAAVNGLALGGGCEIALACDLVIASESAAFGLPEVKRGLIAGGGGVLRLPRLIPRRLATELILTGEPMPAARALEVGLINRVTPPHDLLPAARRLAATIAANGPLAVRTSKRLMRDSLAEGSDWSPAIWAMNTAASDRIVASADAAEGARAFVQKRSPVWTGR